MNKCENVVGAEGNIQITFNHLLMEIHNDSNKEHNFENLYNFERCSNDFLISPLVSDFQRVFRPYL